MGGFNFLPFFGQKADGVIHAVSLLSLTAIEPYLRTLYFMIVIGLLVSGILTLALQNLHQAFWVRSKHKPGGCAEAIGPHGSAVGLAALNGFF